MFMDQVTQTVSTLIRSLKLSRIAGMHGMPKARLICINSVRNNACHTESVLNATGPLKRGHPDPHSKAWFFPMTKPKLFW